MRLSMVVSMMLGLTCSAFPQQSRVADLKAGSKQLMVVTTPGWDAVDGRLQRFERAGDGEPWHAVGEAAPIVVGRNGMGWGLGLIPMDSLRTENEPLKREGDGKSPAGVFALGTAFGFAEVKPAEWKMPYLALTPSIDCVDDADSDQYNRVADRAAINPEWKSAEHMRAVGEAYRWGAVIEQNPAAVKNAGSCVFLHVWSGAGHGTAGCTAMAKPLVEMVLGWMDPAQKPLLVEMPQVDYARVRKTLDLPVLQSGISR